MRIGRFTEGGHPYATGGPRLWCDRLVRGRPQHEFDLFALSRSAHREELYARTPVRPAAHAGPAPPGPGPGAHAGWTLLALLPGSACLATAGLVRATEGVLGEGARAAVTVAGGLLACLALRLRPRRGPLCAPEGAGRAGIYACWSLSFAVYGEELIAQVVSGGPDGPWQVAPAALLGLGAAVAPAAPPGAPPPQPPHSPTPEPHHSHTAQHHRSTARPPRSRRRGPCPTPHELTEE